MPIDQKMINDRNPVYLYNLLKDFEERIRGIEEALGLTAMETTPVDGYSEPEISEPVEIVEPVPDPVENPNGDVPPEEPEPEKKGKKGKRN